MFKAATMDSDGSFMHSVFCVECRLSCKQPVGDNQCSEFGISVQDQVRRVFLLVNLSQDARCVPGCVFPEIKPPTPRVFGLYLPVMSM